MAAFDHDRHRPEIEPLSSSPRSIHECVYATLTPGQVGRSAGTDNENNNNNHKVNRNRLKVLPGGCCSRRSAASAAALVCQCQREGLFYLLYFIIILFHRPAGTVGGPATTECIALFIILLF